MAASRVRSESPLIVILGPTASGKTTVAIEIAARHGGEIICADSRTVYKGMDIGTAKASTLEQAQVPHFGIDLVEPDERFTVADFKIYTLQKIIEIRQRGHIPILAGGTGLYIDSVLFDFDFSRSEDRPVNWRNKSIDNIVVVGIATEKETLRRRINTRVEQLLINGVVEESTILGEKYDWNLPAMKGNIYPIVHSYLKNEITTKELVDKSTTLDWKLAKRQMTWFRPNPHIEWCDISEVEAYIDSRLASEQYL